MYQQYNKFATSASLMCLGYSHMDKWKRDSKKVDNHILI